MVVHAKAISTAPIRTALTMKEGTTGPKPPVDKEGFQVTLAETIAKGLPAEISLDAQPAASGVLAKPGASPKQQAQQVAQTEEQIGAPAEESPMLSASERLSQNAIAEVPQLPSRATTDTISSVKTNLKKVEHEKDVSALTAVVGPDLKSVLPATVTSPVAVLGVLSVATTIVVPDIPSNTSGVPAPSGSADIPVRQAPVSSIQPQGLSPASVGARGDVSKAENKTHAVSVSSPRAETLAPSASVADAHDKHGEAAGIAGGSSHEHASPSGAPVQQVSGLNLSAVAPHSAGLLAANTNSRTSVIASSASTSLATAPGKHSTAVTTQIERPGEPRTLAASPTALEVGVANGTHGWLRVRAELNPAGVVTAAVVASSATSVENLTRHLPAMNEYLAQGATAIGLIVVHASSASSVSTGLANSFGSASSMGQLGGGQSGQASSGGEGKYVPGVPSPAVSHDNSDDIGTASTLNVSWGGTLSASPSRMGGGVHWVSVRV